MKFTRSFKQLRKSDSSIAGGKGISLGEMTQAGFPVPSGFVILAGAFDRFLQETDLDVEVESILHKVDHKKIHTVENASEEIEALILEARVPPDIIEEIKQNFIKLKSKFVAVRSSATAEDSSLAAWAGQLESYLNTTQKNLLENVKRCWASLFTARAIFYRFEKGLHRQKISVAIVVQKMVESAVSGVCFTVHPVTRDRDQMVIEAGYGLGEAIVGGKITPDTYVILKRNFSILDVNISEQKVMIARGPKGTGELMVPKSKRARQKLPEEKIKELARLCRKLEKHYKKPQDIEWAYEKDKLWITQSRAITTL